MRQREKTYLVGDFETTVYEGQTDTAVWAAAVVPLWSEDVTIYHSIEDCWNGIRQVKGDVVCYFHNLKFDGAFWLDFLLIQAGYKQAVDDVEDVQQVRFQHQKDMENGTLLVGGLIRLYFDKKKGESEEEKKRKVENGVLYSSGLIAGEGLVGILLAVCAVIPFKGETFADAFNLSAIFGFSLGNIGGLVFFALLAVTLILFIRGKKKKEN